MYRDEINETKYTMVGKEGYCDFCGKKCVSSSSLDMGVFYEMFFVVVMTRKNTSP